MYVFQGLDDDLWVAFHVVRFADADESLALLDQKGLLSVYVDHLLRLEAVNTYNFGLFISVLAILVWLLLLAVSDPLL